MEAHQLHCVQPRIDNVAVVVVAPSACACYTGVDMYTPHSVLLETEESAKETDPRQGILHHHRAVNR